MLKNVIITGSEGFVGSHTVRYFSDKGAKVIAMDIHKTPVRTKTVPNVTYIRIEEYETTNSLIKKLEEKAPEILEEGIDVFIHFAWKGSAGPLRANYSAQLSNAKDVITFLKAAAKIHCGKFVCAGSIMEIETERAVHGQGNKPGMAYIYGTGKLAAHCIAKCVASEEGIDLVWGMITNAYGPGESSPRFINATLRKIVNEEKLEFTSATQNYDFIHVDDAAKAFYFLADKGKPFKEYIIGSGKAKPLKEFIVQMIKATGANTETVFGDVPYTGVNLSLEDFSIKNIQEDTGFVPEISFEQGISETWDWIRELSAKAD